MARRLRVLLSRFAARLGHCRDPEFEDELNTHLSLLVERFIRQGLTPEEATYAARRQFGGLTQIREQHYESQGCRWLDTLWQDLRLTVRLLRRSPGFTLTVLAVLALGIGANTAVFSIVNAVLLKPLNASHPDSIVRLLEVYGRTVDNTVGARHYVETKELTDVFEEVAAHRLEWMNLNGVEQPEQIPVARATASFFDLFGAAMSSGRPFSGEDDRPISSRMAVISYSLSTRHFGGTAAVGARIVLGGLPYVITGVLAPWYNTEQFDPVPDAWIPFQIDPNAPEQGDRVAATIAKFFTLTYYTQC
jgi:putative ABC transport system permease protein